MNAKSYKSGCCVAVKCSMRAGTNLLSEIKMYKFPKNPARRRQWEIAVRRKNWTATNSSTLCSLHFVTRKPSADPLHVDYVPMVFAHVKNNNSTDRYQRHVKRLKIDQDIEARNILKNLGQEYGKQLKKNDNRSGETASDNDVQWLYILKPQFLQDQFTPRETTSNLSTANSSSSSDMNIPDTKIFDEDEESNIPNENEESPVLILEKGSPQTSPEMPPSSEDYTKMGYKQCSTPQIEIGEKLLDLEKEKLEHLKRKRGSDYNDEDIGFFNSLLPHVKKLSPNEKFLFRFKVQKVLYDFLFPQKNETNIETPGESNSQCNNNNEFELLV